RGDQADEVEARGLVDTLMRPLCLALLVALAGALLGAGCGKSTRSSPKNLRLVAIGDSIPFGRGFCGGCVPFPNLFATAITRDTGNRVTVSNMSEDTGINSSDLRKELTSPTSLRASVARADAITVTVGHNDPPWSRSDDVCDGRGDIRMRTGRSTTPRAYARRRPSTRRISR